MATVLVTQKAKHEADDSDQGLLAFLHQLNQELEVGIRVVGACATSDNTARREKEEEE